MAQLKIVIGNKKYSSWSLRGWLTLKQIGVPFEEILIPLDQPNTQEQIARYSPSGRVPTLIDGEVVVWDSLAICEYLNERFPDRHLWPADRKACAVARSISAEMHSGFQNLRNDLSMKIVESIPTSTFRPEVKEEIRRIIAIWTDCRRRFAGGKPFLFGDFSIADVMFAPVVSRFRTYGVPLEGTAAAYGETIWKLPAIQEWLAAAKIEPHRMARYEASPR
jgi:glutathione S-transferase